MGRIGPMTYSQVVERVLGAEQQEENITRVRAFNNRKDSQSNRDSNGNKRSGKDFHPKSYQNKKPKNDQQNKQFRQQQWARCQKCGKNHLGECRETTKGCYKCGKDDHFIKNCPLWKNQPKNEEPQKTNARIFAISHTDAEASNPVVSSEISIVSIPTYALIDSGATHSFASMTYAKRLGRSSEKLSEWFSTMLPSGEILYSSIYIDGRELYVDQVVLEMHDYDVILGMDWLSKYNATIDCRRKIVLFKPYNEDPFMFVGTLSRTTIPLISTMKTKRLLEGGCTGFLANVTDISMEQKLKPDDVPIV
ncbi:uncharacterized protein LOC133813966 [Humulus lupulus]|uniref:uncharacterized protein LOC133813966 n=1 Tax=Humulus lupulus TaxID=3486 RepID=UPI002B415639|nr:uncharacterized protein LOC133813966 [Humulus lupulus]